MKWKKEYELGIPEIDAQHRKLVEIINQYKNDLSNKDINSYKEIGEILVYLINYTSYHFDAEENLMQSIGYPELGKQREIHNDLRHKIKDILIKIKNRQSYTKIEFYYFLMDWLNNHILGEDIKIGQYCRENNKELRPLKTELLNPSSTLLVVKPNLDRLEVLYKSANITLQDRDFQRLIFLKEFFENFLIDTPILFYNLILAIELLHDKKLITSSETTILMDYLNCNNIIKKSYITESDLYHKISEKTERLNYL